ncbi:MAG: hypothetical protein JNM57_09480 [Cyclobacteriaceae bacterium]|nr:hypothetical protein [Cyclobacteriaceae bacterium]
MNRQENKSINPNTPSDSSNQFTSEVKGRALGGIIVVLVGTLLLVDRMGVDLPHWLISWPWIPIIAGVYFGVRSNFQGWSWMIPIGVGVLFLTGEIIQDYSMDRFFWPIIIITIGIVMIFRPKREGKSWREKYGTEGELKGENLAGEEIEAVTIFGGSKKVIISKNFKGGEVITVFGGAEVNLTQADIQGRAELELVQVFGGAKLIVPSNWRVHTGEVVCIFGGIDDKRNPVTLNADPSKVLILKGMCMFGGIDIKSY